MAESGNTGLEADIGVTMGKMLKQLSAIEARMMKTAKAGEKAFADANPRIVRSFQQMEKSASRASSVMGGQGFRQASMQLSQVAQQGAATGNYLQALAIQLPDLALGFGTVGIFAGIAAGALLPLVGNMISTGDNAEALKEDLERLGESVKALDELSNTYSTEGIQQLIEKYGELSEEILVLTERRRQFAIDEANASAIAAVQALRDEYGSLFSDFEGGGRLAAQSAARVKNELGLGRDEAIELRDALNAARDAANFEERADALARVSAMLAESTVKSGEFAVAVLDAEDSMRQLAASAPDASWMNAAIDGVAALGDAIRARITEAIALRSQATTDAAGNQTPFEPGSTARTRPRSKTIDTLGNWEAARDAAAKAAAGTSGRRGGGGGGRSKANEPINAQDEINQITRQLEMLGKVDAQVAAMTARYRLLDEAKKRGLDLDKAQAGSSVTLRQEIDAQAETIGRLTAKHDELRERAEFFNGLQDDMKSGFLDAIVAGESFAGVLQGVAQALAKAALQAAIFGTGPMSGGGGGLGGLFSSIFNKASGGPVRAGQPYRVNEQTPNSEIFVPSTNGAILNSSQAQKALGGGRGGSVVNAGATISINVSGASGDDHVVSLVKQGVREGMKAMDKALPARFEQISRNPRRR